MIHAEYWAVPLRILTALVSTTEGCTAHLKGKQWASETPVHAGSCGPQSVHSAASNLSRSGSFAPSTLSVLYENQAMKMERAELKSELKLISARVGHYALGLFGTW